MSLNLRRIFSPSGNRFRTSLIEAVVMIGLNGGLVGCSGVERSMMTGVCGNDMDKRQRLFGGVG